MGRTLGGELTARYTGHLLQDCALGTYTISPTNVIPTCHKRFSDGEHNQHIFVQAVLTGVSTTVARRRKQCLPAVTVQWWHVPCLLWLLAEIAGTPTGPPHAAPRHVASV